MALAQQPQQLGEPDGSCEPPELMGRHGAAGSVGCGHVLHGRVGSVPLDQLQSGGPVELVCK